MLYQTAIVLAFAICSANSAYLVSVSNDLESLSSDCNYQACDQLCRRLGFPGGACVGDRCKCDNFLQSQVENEIPIGSKIKIDQNILRDEPKPEEKDILFVNIDDIKQDIFRSEEKPVLRDEEKPEVNLRSAVSRGSCDCVPRNCDMYCFRIHYTGGICVTGQCRCYR